MRITSLSNLAIVACLAIAIGTAQADTLLTNVTLVDIESGALLEGQSLLTCGGVIAEVGPEITALDIAVVDGAGDYLIPAGSPYRRTPRPR